MPGSVPLLTTCTACYDNEIERVLRRGDRLLIEDSTVSKLAPTISSRGEIDGSPTQVSGWVESNCLSAEEKHPRRISVSLAGP